MKTPILFCSALIIGLSSISSLSQAREGDYGGFTKENIQEFNDYITGLEMIKVQEGEELDQAIDAIPINLEEAIDLEQERGLRDWLRQYLIAFSESGNDSLAAVFYLRDGFDKERYKETEMRFAEDIHARKFVVQNEDGSMMTEDEIENIVEKTRTRVETALREENPISILRSEHRTMLNSFDKEYFIESVSFRDSEFRVFELNKGDKTFFRMAEERGMLPRGFLKHTPAFARKLPTFLESGKSIICADILFIVEEPLIVEEPSESALALTIPGRTPSFFRLMWGQDKMWHHIEIFFSLGAREAHLFSFI